MLKGVQLALRTLSQRESYLGHTCAKCLKTSSTASGSNNSCGKTAKDTLVKSTKTSNATTTNSTRANRSQISTRGFSDSTHINRTELAPSRTGSEFAEAKGGNFHPGVIEPSSVKGKPHPGSLGSTRSVAYGTDSRAANIEVHQIPVPEYTDETADNNVFRGLDGEFPCQTDNKTSGPEPEYDNIVSGYKTFHYKKPFYFKYRKGVVPELKLAYETWGQLNEQKDNAVIIFTGLSASSHAKSHEDNQRPGWWEKFVGPGCAINTDEFFVICVNNLGGCYGSTGPSSISPITNKPYGTSFPILSVEDIVRSQYLLLDDLGIEKVYASVGSSLGGMLSLSAAVLHPNRVGRVIAISSCVRSHPTSIAMRYLQRKAIMMDPDWNKGHYYNTGKYPKSGMKLARELATLTYRSGPEWEERFGRKRIKEGSEPTLCPHFMIENYLDYQGETASTKLDPNTLVYISKAMDMFDLGEAYGSLHDALGRVKCPVMVIGVQTDILFPVWQQRELANILQESGNHAVTYYELNSIYGHDTFLLDLSGVGAGVKGFLETQLKEMGRTRARVDRV